jgi:hypothetical protein
MLKEESMLKRIWTGNINLAWAFWGIGLLGTYPLFALMIGIILLGVLISNTHILPLPFRMMSLQMFGGSSMPLLIGAGFGFLALFTPSIVIWRAANNTISKLWRRAAKSYVVLAIILTFIGPPFVLFMIFISYMEVALTPEHLIDTPQLTSEAPKLFKKHTGLSMPPNTNVAHVVYQRYPVLDYEFDHHVIINAEMIDLEEWADTARPFGNKLVRQLPKTGLEWSTEGLDCSIRVTQSICNLVKEPREVLHLRHQIDIDNVVTLTIMEDDKLIWLHETQW